MENKIILFILFSVLFTLSSSKAQDIHYAERTFYDTRVLNGQSVETTIEGVLQFNISHRFGAINKGIYDFFGFDDANMRLGFDYGIKDWFTLGIGRNSFEKTYDGFTKFKLIRQKTGISSFPFTLTFFSSVAFKTQREVESDIDVELKHKTYYSFQLLMARKFSESFSLQIMPSLVHRNLVETSLDEHDVIAFGIAPKISINKMISINVEYYMLLPDQLPDEFQNSLGLGVVFETKGHVFQLNVGNSRGLIEKSFITETTDKWEEGQIHFGFNIIRDFKIKGRKYQSYPVD